MKGLFTIITLFCAVVICSAQSRKSKSTGSPVDITVKVRDYANEAVVLGYYFNNKMLVKDTVFTDSQCLAHFKRDSLFEQGIYVLHFPKNGRVFDILMTQNQKFFIECDTMPKTVERIVVKGNDVLNNFFVYQTYLNDQQKYYADMMQRLRNAKSEGEKGVVYADVAVRDSIVRAHTDSVITANSSNFISTFLRAVRDVRIPSFVFPDSYTPEQVDSARKVKSYYYYRAHFYDNFDLTDERLLRTPFFISKIDKYFENTVPQIADSVASEAIRLIEMCRPNPEMFRFFVSHLYNMTNQSKIMGMDAALVAIAKKYYLAGQTPWADEKFLADLKEQIDGIQYTLIGMQAPDLKMISCNDEWFRLSDVSAKYTVLVFWEPSCGHCKKEIPKLKSEVWDKFADSGVKIFSVYCQVEKEPWVKFIEENGLEEWMNVYDPYGRTGFRRFYNIKSTPTMFVLDENKKIVAKKLGVEQIADFLEHMLNE